MLTITYIHVLFISNAAMFDDLIPNVIALILDFAVKLPYVNGLSLFNKYAILKGLIVRGEGNYQWGV